MPAVKKSVYWTEAIVSQWHVATLLGYIVRPVSRLIHRLYTEMTQKSVALQGGVEGGGTSRTPKSRDAKIIISRASKSW